MPAEFEMKLEALEAFWILAGSTLPIRERTLVMLTTVWSI